MADSEDNKKDKPLARTKAEKPEAERANPEPAKPEPATTKRDDSAKKRGTSGLTVFTLFLVLLVAGATGAGGYYLWEQQQQLMRTQQSEDNRLQQQLGDLQNRATGLNQSIQSNNASIRELADTQQETREISQQAMRIASRSQRDWILAEVDYLLRLANRRLQIARDINGAVAALQAADERIHQLGDLNLLAIRKQLAEDIGKLKALHQADVNGTALALEQMLNNVGELPFKSVQQEISAQIEQDSDKDAGAEEPKGFVDSVLDTVRNIGDIKVHQRSIKPASSALQQQHIEQILRNHLLSARLAVLRYDQHQFSHDVQQAQQILHLHYQNDDNRVAQMQADLTRFGNINLTPDLPGITRAWNMLQDVKQQPEKAEKKSPAATNNRSPAGSAGNTPEVL